MFYNSKHFWKQKQDLAMKVYSSKTRMPLTAEKNNDNLNFAGKWMELENTILSEVTQTQKDNYHIYSLISGF